MDLRDELAAQLTATTDREAGPGPRQASDVRGRLVRTPRGGLTRRRARAPGRVPGAEPDPAADVLRHPRDARRAGPDPSRRGAVGELGWRLLRRRRGDGR